MRRRARRRWSVQQLLDERVEMLSALAAIEHGRAKVVTRLKQRAMQKPAARGVIEHASQDVHDNFERAAEGVRHRLLLSDGILSTRGVRPWDDARG
jgi:hypothetical protein